MSRRALTPIVPLVAIAITGPLSSVAVISMQGAKSSSKTAKAGADRRQLSVAIR